MNPNRLCTRMAGVGLSVLLLIGAGCGDTTEETTTVAPSNAVAEQIAENALSATHKDVKFDLRSDGMNLSATAEDGSSVQMQTGAGTAMPADFPKDVPVPADLVLSMVTNTGDGTSVQGTSKSSIDTLAAFYRKEAVEQGWTEAMNFGQPGAMQTLQYTKADRSLSVMIVKEEGGTLVTLVVGNN